MPLNADPPLRQGLHPGVPVELAHVSFGLRNHELQETSAVAGPVSVTQLRTRDGWPVTVGQLG